jgi:hypothetical protein
MVYDSKPYDELKPFGVIKLEIIEPPVDLKLNNAQPKVHVVDTSNKYSIHKDPQRNNIVIL